MNKLWGGRFSGGADEAFGRFNASLRFDRRLLECDARTAMAHLEALARAGAVSEVERQRIKNAIVNVLERSRQDRGPVDRAIERGVEDVHSYLEQEVVKEVGEIGLKLNTGRSRNDQIATDLRLYVRDAIDAVSEGLRKVQTALLDLAESHSKTPMPGYTHLQRAQPVLFAHYLLAYFEMFQRDRLRLADCRRRVNICPLGSGALAGTNYPIDRRLEAEMLGFSGVCHNSIDAVSDRDFAVEFTGAATLTMCHLSRLGEDFILFSTVEFGFFEFGDQVTTGSSLMPQKKNPDALELIRGKAGRVIGSHVSLLAMLKGLPLTYNKDLQEDKEPLFDSVDTLADCLAVVETVLRHTTIHDDRMAQAAASHFMNATELADYLAGRGLPFRRAHEIAGKVVLEALGRKCRLEELSLEELKKHSPLFEDGVYQALSLERSLDAKAAEGGTAPARVAEALTDARRRLEAKPESAEIAPD